MPPQPSGIGPHCVPHAAVVLRVQQVPVGPLSRAANLPRHSRNSTTCRRSRHQTEPQRRRNRRRRSCAAARTGAGADRAGGARLLDLAAAAVIERAALYGRCSGGSAGVQGGPHLPSCCTLAGRQSTIECAAAARAGDVPHSRPCATHSASGSGGPQRWRATGSAGLSCGAFSHETLPPQPLDMNPHCAPASGTAASGSWLRRFSAHGLLSPCRRMWLAGSAVRQLIARPQSSQGAALVAELLAGGLAHASSGSCLDRTESPLCNPRTRAARRTCCDAPAFGAELLTGHFGRYAGVRVEIAGEARATTATLETRSRAGSVTGPHKPSQLV